METEAPPPDERDDDVANVFSLGDPLRRRLYDYVVGRRLPVGREEAADAVDISRSLAAYHLDRMVSDGLLEVSFARRTGRSGPGAGRPAKLYQRSPRQIEVHLPPRDYELAAQLLARAVEDEPTGRARTALEDSARELGRQLATDAGREGGDQQPGGETAVLERVLRQRGYEPFAEEDGTIRLRNCPFDQLAAAHRDLVCGMNLALLSEAVAGQEGVRAVLDPQPGMCCVALVAAPSKRKGRKA